MTAVEEMLFALDDDSEDSEENPKEALIAAGAPTKQASSLRDLSVHIESNEGSSIRGAPTNSVANGGRPQRRSKSKKNYSLSNLADLSTSTLSKLSTLPSRQSGTSRHGRRDLEKVRGTWSGWERKKRANCYLCLLEQMNNDFIYDMTFPNKNGSQHQ